MAFPATFGTALVAVKTWADAQLGVSGALAAYASAPYTTIWAAQDAPHPSYPYAVLRVVEPPRTVGGKAERTVQSSGTIDRMEYDVEFVVRVELLSRAPLDPNSGLDETQILVNGLEASLRASLQQELWNAAGIAFIENRAPVSVPTVAGFGFERRTQLDCLFRARTRIDATLASMDTPNVSGTVNSQGVVTGRLQGA